MSEEENIRKENYGENRRKTVAKRTQQDVSDAEQHHIKGYTIRLRNMKRRYNRICKLINKLRSKSVFYVSK